MALPLSRSFFKSLGRVSKLDSNTNKIVLGRRKIYIIPTRYGFMFGIMVFAMLIGSNNYGSNFGFMLSYLLAGIGMSAMLQNWRNLHGLEIANGQSNNVFAGDKAQFQLLLTNQRSTRRGALACKADDIESALDIDASSTKPLCCWVNAPQRGVLKIKRIKLFTRYPMGLFYAWSYLETGQSCLVYPRPSTHDSDAVNYGGEQLEKPAHTKEAPSDFKGHREFVVGDNMKHVDWKAFARKSAPTSATLMKEFTDEQGDQIWLKWDQQSNTPEEEQLSDLCANVLHHAKGHNDFGLSLPSQVVQPNNGERHKTRCLEALALHGQS